MIFLLKKSLKWVKLFSGETKIGLKESLNHQLQEL